MKHTAGAALRDFLDLPFVAEEFFSHALCVADVGAAGGIDPLFRGPFGTGSHIRYFGFEPNPAEVAKLRRDESTQYFDWAISDKVGRGQFRALGTVGSLGERPGVERLHGGAELVDVRIETLQSLRDNGTLPGLDIVKTDVEEHDLAVLRGTELSEVLCVKSEFSWSPRVEGNIVDMFSLLSRNGMILFGLQQNVGVVNELSGGDALFLRSIDHLLAHIADPTARRSKVLKLTAICLALRNLDYAYVVNDIAMRAGVLSDAESQSINRIVESHAYLPNLFTAPGVLAHLAQFFSMMAILFSGWQWRAKSLPKDNRFVPFRQLFVSTRSFGLLPRARKQFRQRLQWYYQERKD